VNFCDLVLEAEWTDLHQILRHRIWTITGTPQVCLGCLIHCFASKPEQLKGQTLHFLTLHVKIRAGMGEIYKSIFTAIIYAPMHVISFRYVAPF